MPVDPLEEFKQGMLRVSLRIQTLDDFIKKMAAPKKAEEEEDDAEHP